MGKSGWFQDDDEALSSKRRGSVSLSGHNKRELHFVTEPEPEPLPVKVPEALKLRKRLVLV